MSGWRKIFAAKMAHSKLLHAVPRAAALGWYVFPQRRHYLAYMMLAVGIYAWNIFSCMFLRKIKDIPKASLPKVRLSIDSSAPWPDVMPSSPIWFVLL